MVPSGEYDSGEYNYAEVLLKRKESGQIPTLEMAGRRIQMNHNSETTPRRKIQDEFQLQNSTEERFTKESHSRLSAKRKERIPRLEWHDDGFRMNPNIRRFRMIQ